MSNIPKSNRELTLFSLYPYGNTDFEEQIEDHINAGNLPEDVLFRLAAIGTNQVDSEGNRLSWVTLKDLIDHAHDHELLRDDSAALLTSAPPNAIIDWYINVNQHVRRTYDDMYYSVGNLTRVIRENNFMDIDDVDERIRISRGVAKGLWRSIVARHHPEWLADPDTYFAPRISFGTVYDGVTERTKKSRIIGCAVLSDPLLLNTYTEAKTVGIRGIAEKGIESLRLLLSDEHPELI